MDDAQRAEKLKLGGKSRFSDDGLKLSKEQELMLVSRVW